MLNTPLQMVLLARAAWVNQQQLAVIEYLREQNRGILSHDHREAA